jgi:outer membrane lipoprotein carrier protein
MYQVNKIHNQLLTLLLVLVGSVAHAGQGPQKLNEFLNDVDDVRAKFEQSILNIETAETGRFQGTFSLSRPNKFRWDYTEPYNKVILADGDTVHIIEDELKQVTYIPQQSALKGTPASILINQKNIGDKFEIIDIGESQGMDWVELIPRDQDSQFTRILIAFLADEMRRMELSDKFGQITRFQFYDVERNPDFDKDQFVFKRLQGYDQIMGEGGY